MEISLGSPAKICAATGHVFLVGDCVCSVLVDDGEAYRRVDVLDGHAKTSAMTGRVVCRWKWTVKPRDDRGREEEKRALDENEAMFLALCDEKNCDDQKEETALIRYLLALALQRKRLLKPVNDKAGEFFHVKSGRLCTALPPKALTPEILKKAAERLCAGK